MEDIILIGGGGHCKSVVDTLLRQGQYNIVGIVDQEENLGKNVSGFPIQYCDNDLEELYHKGIRSAFISLGGIGASNLRKKLFTKAKEIGFMFPNIIDPSAIVAASAIIEDGVFIGKNVVVNVDAKIGSMAIINTKAVVEHDCLIGEFSFVSIGVNLSGNVTIGANTQIGTGANVIQGISIGENSIIGAGSVVVKDIRANTQAVGVPCREIKKC